MTHQTFLFCGAGHLAQYFLKGSRDFLSSFQIFAETKSSVRHETLAELGVKPATGWTGGQFDACLFAIPPGEGVSAKLNLRLKSWSKAGPFVFVSTTAVFKESGGAWVDEKSETGDSERQLELLAMESAVQKAGGRVIRFAGLYDEARGPHRVYQRQATSGLRPDGYVNLIHYQDAAEILRRIFLLPSAPAGALLGCDSMPVTREQIGALFSCQFNGVTGELGKRLRNPETCRILAWEPSFTSFLDAARTWKTVLKKG